MHTLANLILNLNKNKNSKQFFLKTNKFFVKDIFFEDMIFAQHIKITMWCLFDIKSYDTIRDSRREKNF